MMLNEINRNSLLSPEHRSIKSETIRGGYGEPLMFRHSRAYYEETFEPARLRVKSPSPKLYQARYQEHCRQDGQFGVVRVFDGVYVCDQFAAKVSKATK